MNKRNKPYGAGGLFIGPDKPDFYRSSRMAFGHSFKVDKPSRDWMWFVGTVIVMVILAAVMV